MLRARECERSFNEKKNSFFLEVDKLFNFYPWKQEEIIAYCSIFNFCPRFLEDYSFQFFVYDDNDLQLFTIFHECLHFIFYDFAKENFKDSLSKMDTEKGIFWDLAEVFNAVIQDTNEFILLHGKIKGIGYLEHKELIRRGSIVWKNNKNVYN